MCPVEGVWRGILGVVWLKTGYKWRVLRDVYSRGRSYVRGEFTSTETLREGSGDMGSGEGRRGTSTRRVGTTLVSVDTGVGRPAPGQEYKQRHKDRGVGVTHK